MKQHLLRAASFFVATLMLVPRTSLAATSVQCEIYREYFPHIYDIACKKSPQTAGKGSSFANSFNMNAGSLPTSRQPLGFELIGSIIRKSLKEPLYFEPTFSVIKGFQKVGTGVSTSGNNTFYGNDILRRAKGSANLDDFRPVEEAKRKGRPDLNVGTAFLIRKKEQSVLNLGISLRYNHITDSFGGGPGLIYGNKHFAIGAGVTRERVSNFLPGMYFFSGLFTFRILVFEFEYNLLKNVGGWPLSPIHIGTVTFAVKNLFLTAAARSVEYHQDGRIIQKHFAIQYRFSRHFAAAYLYNYIPGTHSLATQVFL